MAERPPFTIDPQTVARETNRHYIAANDAEIKRMLKETGKEALSDLFQHIPESIRFKAPLPIPEEQEYEAVADTLHEISEKNHRLTSFIGDGLPHWKEHPVVGKVASIRKLATSYTPYQPERSQGTLLTHWIYQCVMSMLTGFEAINTSLYDRATGLYEAVSCALRLKRNTDTVIVPEALYPGDLEVLQTLVGDTDIRICTLPLDPETGTIPLEKLATLAGEAGSRLAGIIFPQVNTLGLLEDVDGITNLCHDLGVKAIAVIDPMLLVTGALKPPSAFGREGADMIVGEAQHLAISPNFGGPGLGLFGVRFHGKTKNDVRQTPGRFIGKAHDLAGRDCRVMILSTREQHIRKDKATSNICSNQAFLASLAGASVLARGDTRLMMDVREAYMKARGAAARLVQLEGVDLAFPDAPFFNELTLSLPEPAADVLRAAREVGLHLGVDVSGRLENPASLLKLSFSDIHSAKAVGELLTFFESRYPKATPKKKPGVVDIPDSHWREDPVGLPDLEADAVLRYYQELGEMNVGPEDAIFPLGSCTMKYNPYLNEWAAGLPGFTQVHPQAPLEDVQGCLQVLYETQEWFKGITGLAGVTTQPVAGAQGELVGIKLFQAYHRSRGESHRNVILIPHSAHGTNFATAVMAGYPTKLVDGKKAGIVLLDADATGRIDLEHLDRVLAEHEGRVAGIMVTNPNTGGVFETEFKTIADKVHQAGGLVYMDGANMNAIAGWVDLGAMGVDAVHNNTHKTWTIPHGGGGPGDAFVAVSEKLVDFMPGFQAERKADGTYTVVRPAQSIGSFQRHWGNFAHKVRCFAYLLRLGREGVPRMSAAAVLSARYLHHRLTGPLPEPAQRVRRTVPRMHEFIITLSEDDFHRIEASGTPKAQIIPRVGKLFLDFGYHAPTVAFPEVFGLMIEPTESYSQAELDRFADTIIAIQGLVRQSPEVLKTAPHFTPVDRVDEVGANRNLVLSEPLSALPPTHPNRASQAELLAMDLDAIAEKIREAHQAAEAAMTEVVS
jgi:glycine dehydrogenase